MPLTEGGQRVLDDILAIGAERQLTISNRLRVQTPGPADLYEFCELLAECPKEEPLQQFLQRKPGFLTGLLGGPDNADLAVLFKPPVGTQYRQPDFCVLQASQGGAVAHLVEIESSHERLFNKNGGTARRLADAMKQIEDWRIWISKSPVPYVKDLIRLARELPALSEFKDGDRGFRLDSADNIESHWQAFSGFDDPYFSFTIIIGRWSQLSKNEKERLIFRNRTTDQPLLIHTYEQVARNANFRLERDDWHNELDHGGDIDQLSQPFDR